MLIDHDGSARIDTRSMRLARSLASAQQRTQLDEARRAERASRAAWRRTRTMLEAAAFGAACGLLAVIVLTGVAR